MYGENHVIQGSVVNSHAGRKPDLKMRTRQKENP